MKHEPFGEKWKAHFKFVELNIPIDERVPEGYRLILAYVKDYDIVIPIAQLPEKNEETIGLHNCENNIREEDKNLKPETAKLCEKHSDELKIITAWRLSCCEIKQRGIYERI